MSDETITGEHSTDEQLQQYCFQEFARIFALLHGRAITAGVHVQGRYYFVLDKQPKLYVIRHRIVAKHQDINMPEYEYERDSMITPLEVGGQEVLVVRSTDHMPSEVVVALLRQGGIVQ